MEGRQERMKLKMKQVRTVKKGEEIKRTGKERGIKGLSNTTTVMMLISINMLRVNPIMC